MEHGVIKKRVNAAEEKKGEGEIAAILADGLRNAKQVWCCRCAQWLSVRMPLLCVVVVALTPSSCLRLLTLRRC